MALMLYTGQRKSDAVRFRLPEAGVPGRAHWLRKAAAARLAEGGKSEKKSWLLRPQDFEGNRSLHAGRSAAITGAKRFRKRTPADNDCVPPVQDGHCGTPQSEEGFENVAEFINMVPRGRHHFGI